ncbi:hypothetical protein U1298_10755, partial [Enterococcus cecorum]|uniref:hypothetical protein n=1 Tax=Enterococcus cecorum TaxID=44008 RepID=UPI002ACA106A
SPHTPLSAVHFSILFQESIDDYVSSLLIFLYEPIADKHYKSKNTNTYTQIDQLNQMRLSNKYSTIPM